MGLILELSKGSRVQQPFDELVQILVSRFFYCQSTFLNIAICLFSIIFEAKLPVNASISGLAQPDLLVVLKILHCQCGKPLKKLLVEQLIFFIISFRVQLLCILQDHFFCFFVIFYILVKIAANGSEKVLCFLKPFFALLFDKILFLMVKPMVLLKMGLLISNRATLLRQFLVPHMRVIQLI